MSALLSVSWPLVAPLALGTGLDGSGLSLALGAGVLLILVVIAIRVVRPVVAVSLLAPDIEPFASLRSRIRISDPGAEGHVRSRAPGGLV